MITKRRGSFRRIASFLLACVLMLGCLPAGVLALPADEADAVPDTGSGSATVTVDWNMRGSAVIGADADKDGPGSIRIDASPEDWKEFVYRDVHAGDTIRFDTRDDALPFISARLSAARDYGEPVSRAELAQALGVSESSLGDSIPEIGNGHCYRIPAVEDLSPNGSGFVTILAVYRGLSWNGGEDIVDGTWAIGANTPITVPSDAMIGDAVKLTAKWDFYAFPAASSETPAHGGESARMVLAPGTAGIPVSASLRAGSSTSMTASDLTTVFQSAEEGSGAEDADGVRAVSIPGIADIPAPMAIPTPDPSPISGGGDYVYFYVNNPDAGGADPSLVTENYLTLSCGGEALEGYDMSTSSWVTAENPIWITNGGTTALYRFPSNNADGSADIQITGGSASWNAHVPAGTYFTSWASNNIHHIRTSALTSSPVTPVTPPTPVPGGSDTVWFFLNHPERDGVDPRAELANMTFYVYSDNTCSTPVPMAGGSWNQIVLGSTGVAGGWGGQYVIDNVPAGGIDLWLKSDPLPDGRVIELPIHVPATSQPSSVPDATGSLYGNVVAFTTKGRDFAFATLPSVTETPVEPEPVIPSGPTPIPTPVVASATSEFYPVIFNYGYNGGPVVTETVGVCELELVHTGEHGSASVKHKITFGFYDPEYQWALEGEPYGWYRSRYIRPGWMLAGWSKDPIFTADKLKPDGSMGGYFTGDNTHGNKYYKEELPAPGTAPDGPTTFYGMWIPNSISYVASGGYFIGLSGALPGEVTTKGSVNAKATAEMKMSTNVFNGNPNDAAPYVVDAYSYPVPNGTDEFLAIMGQVGRRDPVKPGYSFKGWYYDEWCIVGPMEEYETGIQPDRYYFAGWEPDPVYVRYYDTREGGTLIAEQVYKYGDKLSLLDAPEDTDGQRFTGWSVEVNGAKYSANSIKNLINEYRYNPGTRSIDLTKQYLVPYDREKDGVNTYVATLNWNDIISGTLTTSGMIKNYDCYWVMNVYTNWEEKHATFDAAIDWEDFSDNDGSRPRSVTIGLKSSLNDRTVQTATLTEADDIGNDVWVHQFTGLPITTSDSSVEEITYSIYMMSYEDSKGNVHEIHDTAASSGEIIVATASEEDTSVSTTYKVRHQQLPDERLPAEPGLRRQDHHGLRADHDRHGHQVHDQMGRRVRQGRRASRLREAGPAGGRHARPEGHGPQRLHGAGEREPRHVRGVPRRRHLDVHVQGLPEIQERPGHRVYRGRAGRRHGVLELERSVHDERLPRPLPDGQPGRGRSHGRRPAPCGEQGRQDRDHPVGRPAEPGRPEAGLRDRGPVCLRVQRGDRRVREEVRLQRRGDRRHDRRRLDLYVP